MPRTAASIGLPTMLPLLLLLREGLRRGGEGGRGDPGEVGEKLSVAEVKLLEAEVKLPEAEEPVLAVLAVLVAGMFLGGELRDKEDRWFRS